MAEGKIKDILFYDGIHKKWVPEPPTYTSTGYDVGVKATGENTDGPLLKMVLENWVTGPRGEEICFEREEREDVPEGDRIEGLECKGKGNNYGQYRGWVTLSGRSNGPAMILDKWGGWIALMKEIPSPPEPPPEKANLTGFIHDAESSPIPGVSVSLNLHRTNTSADGIFNILEVDPGSYMLICRKEGYETYRSPITLVEGNNGPIDIEMPAIVGRKDPLDTIIRKMEELRPECPIRQIEMAWVDFTEKVIEVTPKIRILP